MIFYDYTYFLDQDMDQVFDYFLHKEYLCKIFREEEEEIALHSMNDEVRMQQGEQMELIVGDSKSISSFRIDVLEIQQAKLIDLSINVHEFVDKGLSTIEEDQETITFLKKHLGLDMYFRLEFYQDFDMIRVRETGEIKNQNLAWYAKGFWKILGWYYHFKQRTIHDQVKKEIESSSGF